MLPFAGEEEMLPFAGASPLVVSYFFGVRISKYLCQRAMRYID